MFTRAKAKIGTTSQLGEGIIHVTRDNSLYWVDIHPTDPKIYQFNLETHQYSEWSLDPDKAKNVSTVIPTTNPDKFLISANTQIHIWTKSQNLLELLKTTHANLPENYQKKSPIRFNDGKLDPQGNFFVGTLDMLDRPNRANLYQFIHDPKPQLTRLIPKLGPLTLSNGLAWSPDGKTLYHVDTPERRIRAYEYDPQKVHIGKPRFDIDLFEEDGVPDGICTDSQGNLYVAMWDGSQIIKIDPKPYYDLPKMPTRLNYHFLRLPVATKRPTNCQVIQDQHLFVTSANNNLHYYQLIPKGIQLTRGHQSYPDLLKFPQPNQIPKISQETTSTQQNYYQLYKIFTTHNNF